uniref:Putative secreted protein n=1 Tax=Amblyomma triste TaxID=251400 RepID=A0A023G469_AMBTT
MEFIVVISTVFVLTVTVTDANEQRYHISSPDSLRNFQNPRQILQTPKTVYLRLAPKDWVRDNNKCMKSNLIRVADPGKTYERTIEFYALDPSSLQNHNGYEYVILNVSMTVREEKGKTYIDAVEFSNGDTFPVEDNIKKPRAQNPQVSKLRPEA